eukprot:s1215_g21.t1
MRLYVQEVPSVKATLELADVSGTARWCCWSNLEVTVRLKPLGTRLASSVSFFRVVKMLRVAARSIAARTFSASLRPAIRPAAVLPSRSFAAAAASKPKMEDGTLEGRYATALFMASKDKLDKVYGDLSALRGMMAESQEPKSLGKLPFTELKLAIETPGIEPDSKVAAFEAICSKAGMDGAVVNFLKVLVENKRAHLLSRMIDIFEDGLRHSHTADYGLVLCKVTSAAPLTSAQQGEVKAAMQKRAQGSELIMEYNTNPALLGGLVVKMGEDRERAGLLKYFWKIQGFEPEMAVLDNSVSTRLERLQYLAETWQPGTYLELGSGTGLVGLSCALWGAKVRLTDLPEVTALLDFNVALNRARGLELRDVKVIPHEWGTDLQDLNVESLDVVVMADLVYDVEASKQLMITLIALAAGHDQLQFIMAFRPRNVEDIGRVDAQLEWTQSSSGTCRSILTLPRKEVPGSMAKCAMRLGRGVRSPPVLGGGARPVMCYPDPHSAAGPNGGLPFRCYGMAMLQDSAEAIRGVSLPNASRVSPFETADPMQGMMPIVPCWTQMKLQRRRRNDFL